MDENSSGTDDLDDLVTQQGLVDGLRVFDRYRVKGKLGRGGMGVVWRAFDEVLERDVALKFLPDNVCADHAALDELKRETRRGLDLNHPNIVRIYDFAGGREVGTDAAIAMEYIDGETLSGMRVDRPQKVFTADGIAPWIAQLCEALEYAHTGAKIVHRDLKPANLMVNGVGQLKITDFGIARSISDSVSRMSARVGDTAGTLAYMSPQQADGKRPSPLDDIYGVGAVIYELLTGKPPFHSGEIYQQVLHKVPPRMTDRRVDLDVTASDVIPESWERTVAACLSKDSAERPQSAAEILEMLNAPAAKEKARKEPGRRGVRAPVLLGVLIVVLALAGAGWWFGYEQPRRAEITAAVGQVVEEKVAQAREAIDGKDWDRATALADELASLDPGNGEVSAIRQLVADGRQAEASAVEQERLAEQRKLVGETVTAAQQAIEDEKWDEAESLAGKLAMLDPQNPEIAAIRQSVAKGREAQQAAEAAAHDRLVSQTESLAQKAIVAEDWSTAETHVGKLASLDPQNAKLAGIRKTIAEGREAQRAAEERARATPEDLPESGFFTLAETFASSPYAGYNDYSKREILRQAQEKLKEGGFYDSSIDGLPGSGTTGAIIGYQRANAPLEISGRLDAQTLAALDLEGIAEKAAPTPTPRPKPTSTRTSTSRSSGNSGFFSDGTW